MASSMSSRQSKEVKVTLAVTVGNTGISRGNKANSGHLLVENHIKYSSTWNSILTNIVEKYFIHLIQHNYLPGIKQFKLAEYLVQYIRADDFFFSPAYKY